MDAFISFLIHLSAIMLLLGKTPDSSKKIFYSPVYSVNLVDMPLAPSAQKKMATFKIQKGSMWEGPNTAGLINIKTPGTRSHAMLTIREKSGKNKGGAAAKNINNKPRNTSSASQPNSASGTASGGTNQAANATNLRFSRYYQAVWNKIQTAWVLPGYDKKRKGLEAVVIIKISRTGKILNIKFEKKSGDTALDRSVSRAIKKSAPLPPLPTGFRENFLELGIRFMPGQQ